jgi:hypothetical protein
MSAQHAAIRRAVESTIFSADDATKLCANELSFSTAELSTERGTYITAQLSADNHAFRSTKCLANDTAQSATVVSAIWRSNCAAVRSAKCHALPAAECSAEQSA